MFKEGNESMRKYYLCLFMLLALLVIPSCQEVTSEKTLDAFTKLPLADATEIALVINENRGSDCHSYVVEAIYFTSQPMGEFIAEIESSLLADGWSIHNSNSSAEVKAYRVSYRLRDVADMSISSSVVPTKGSSVPGLQREYIDMNTLALLENYPFDNTDPDDGYFLINFYYHPYLPNGGCRG